MSKLAIPLFGLVLVGSALLAGVASVVAQSSETVVIADGLDPARLDVSSGTTVTWRNEDDARHRVRSREGPVEFDSGDLEPGDAFSVTFHVEGSYPYLDERDDEARDYVGTVVVSPASESSSESAPASVTAAPLAATASAEPAETSAAIDIIDRTFVPASITVAVGDRVAWTNGDDEGHTVTATDGAFESGLMAGGVTFSQVFDTPGIYEYACAIHPNMRGSVTVTAALEATDSQAADPAAGGAVPVAIVDMVYAPTSVEVSAGTIVHWRNDDSVIHTVTARDGSFNSGVMQTGVEYSLAFDTPGTYEYFCAIHPLQSGQVVVTDPGA